MYDELVKRLREADEKSMCGECGLNLHTGATKKGVLFAEAADAIETMCEMVATAHCELANVIQSYEESKPRWIPVTERLPEDGVAVNIVWRNHSPVIYYQHIKDKPQTATGVYYHGRWYWWSAVVQDYLAEYGEWEFDKMDEAIEVTHWMPLPEPPEEE